MRKYFNVVWLMKSQGAIKQLGLFITEWQADFAKTNPSLWVELPPVRFYLHKKFPTDLFGNVVTAYGIDKGFE